MISEKIHLSDVCFKEKGALSKNGLYFMETKSLAPCGIIVSFVLNSCSPMFEISKSSITIAPLAGSTNLNNATVNELLPAPVAFVCHSLKLTSTLYSF